MPTSLPSDVNARGETVGLDEVAALMDALRDPEEAVRVGALRALVRLSLSREAIGIALKTIQSAASVSSLSEALETNYRGSGESACTEAAREGVTAFLEKRKPEFNK